MQHSGGAVKNIILRPIIIQRFFGTSRGVVNDEEEILEVESDPTEHMESSVGEN